MKAAAQKQTVLLEVAAALLVPSAAYGFVRLFIETGPVTAAIGSALAASLLAAVLRHLRIPIGFALLISLAGLGLLLAERFAPGTQRWGIVPTRETLDQLKELTELGAETYRRVRAPIESFDGFVAGVMVASWVMATLTDWAAMRLRLAFEPVLPAALIFGFAAVLGSGAAQVRCTIVFGAAIAFWAVTQRWTSLRTSAVWMGSDAKRGPATVVWSATAVCAIALAAGLVITPLLPGSQADEIYSFRKTSSPTRSPVTPFVEIGQRLVEQSSVPLFTVESESPQYWRVSGLEKYDGDGAVWTTSTSFIEAEGNLDSVIGSPGASETITYTVTIDNLTVDGVGQIWAPTAYAASKVIESTVPLSWNSDNATLTIDGDDTAAFGQGDSFTLESVVPIFDPNELRTANESVPGDIAETYLDLPSDLNPRVFTEAAIITEGASTNYDRALALQDHFRAFDYSISLSQRTGDPIDQFLDERVGFCQQFAGTYALMARSLGIPARVAIGYTWGDAVGGQENTYQVRGKHAHAWPEVWLGEYGWVAFEPTPTRGAPAGRAHTGVEPTQDSVTPTLADPADSNNTPATVPPVNPADIDGPDIVPNPDGGAADATNRGNWTPPSWLLYTLIGAGLYLFGIPLLRQARIAIRRKRADTPDKIVDLAWWETVDELNRSLDLVRQPSETRNEFAARASQDRRLDAEDLTRLSSVATMVRYNPNHATEQAAKAATDSSKAIVERVHERVGLGTRWRRQLDPRRWFN